MKKVGKMIYGDSEHCSDLMYLTGFFVPDPILYFEVDNSQFIIVNEMEFNRAKKTVKDRIRVLSYGQAKTKFDLNNVRVETLVVGLSRHFNINSWHVPPYFPISIVEKLRGKKICFRPSKSAFIPQREIKSNQEIELIREGVATAENALSEALDVLRNSVIRNKKIIWNDQILTSEILRGVINANIARNGGLASHTIVASGLHGADPHEVGAGPLLPNTPIIIDIFPRMCHSGYFGDLTRTVIKGKANDEIARAFDAVSKANKEAKKKVRAGIDAKLIHKAAMDVFKKCGFKTDLRAEVPCGLIHGTGHGLGLDIHETPRIGKKSCILKVGHVVTIEPGLYYPSWGGIRIEDVIAVREDHSETISSAPVEMEIP